MARAWALSWDGGDSDERVVPRIARTLSEDIRRRRLRAGDALPGARALADALGVGRNSVVAAYRELAAEGWITLRPREAPTVALDVPKSSRLPGRRARGLATNVRFATMEVGSPYPPRTERTATRLDLAGGIPDVRLLPRGEVSRAWRRALQRRDGLAALSYGDPRGHRKLRASIAAMLRERRALPVDEDCVLVTRGSQMAISLVARAVLGHGARIGVEDPGYRAAWSAFAGEGATLVPISVDRHGVRVDELVRGRTDAVYLTPHHQYPTTATLSATRRLQLLAHARERKLCVIEDDFDHELAYEGRPVLPLASVDEDGVVVYVGTLSKVLAPGLRVGYVVAPKTFIDTLAAHRFALDRQGDHVTELAISELLDDGTLDRSIRRCRRIYRDRRDALAEALTKRLGDRLSFRVPTGGMSLYADVRGLRGTVSAWSARSLEHGVFFLPGRAFSFSDKESQHARFGFAALDVPEIRESVQRIAKTFRGA